MDDYQLLCKLDAIAEGKSKGFQIGGEFLVAIKKKGGGYVFRNQCPHLGLPLEWQPDHFLNADRSLIQCATHGALFEIDTGYCIHGPCQGQHLEKLEHRCEDGQLLIKLP